MFSFYNAYEHEDNVFAALCEMQKIAEDEEVFLYHENEKEIYGDTVERVQKIMKNVSGLRFVYDPANYVEVGEDTQTALDTLANKTDYFHMLHSLCRHNGNNS